MQPKTFEELDALQARVRKLKLAYEQYFAGIERIAPEQMRDDVHRELRRLRTHPRNNTAWKFKLNTIQSSLMTNQAHWDRICRRIEEGTYKRDKIRAQKRLAETAQPEAPQQGQQPSPKASPTRAKHSPALIALHKAYGRARAQAGQAGNVPIDKLASTVQRQITAVREKYKCKNVEFKVGVKDGKAVLRAVPKK